MQKNSILFLTNAYPDFEYSYRGIFIKKMAEFLFKEGYEVNVVTPKIYKESKYFEKQGGLSVYRFPFLSGNRLLIEQKRIPILRMILYYISGFFVTSYIIFRKKVKLIHAHWVIPTGLIGLFIKIIFKKPLIVSIHGSDLRITLEKKGFIKNIFLFICKMADHIHCVSDFQRKEIEALGFFDKKITVFPMGVDESFLGTKFKNDFELEKHYITILSNRNLIPIYNVSLLIRAIPEIIKNEPDVKFIIGGDGSEKEKIEKEVINLNLNNFVRFTGRIPHDEMPKLLSKADIYVSTSLHDGTSVSLLEAMASGCFPVVSDIPSNREWIINNENGYLFPFNDEKILAKKIVEAIRNKSLREKAIKENISIIKEKAIWPVCIEKIKEIYEKSEKHGIK